MMERNERKRAVRIFHFSFSVTSPFNHVPPLSPLSCLSAADSSKVVSRFIGPCALELFSLSFICFVFLFFMFPPFSFSFLIPSLDTSVFFLGLSIILSFSFSFRFDLRFSYIFFTRQRAPIIGFLSLPPPTANNQEIKGGPDPIMSLECRHVGGREGGKEKPSTVVRGAGESV